MSILLALSSSNRSRGVTDDYFIDFPQAISLEQKPGYKWTVALHKVSSWYSWYNVSQLYGNNVLRYSPDGGATWKVITIPGGQYSYTQLDSAINALIVANGDTANQINILANFSELKFILKVTAPYQVDLSFGNLYQLLGFSSAQIASVITSTTQGLLSANIQNGVDEIYVNCSLVNGSWFNNVGAGEVLNSFLPNSPAGSNILITYTNPIYVPLRSDTQYIRSVHVYLRDNLGRRVDLNGENLNLILHLKMEAI